jgi:hypothetical protein
MATADKVTKVFMCEWQGKMERESKGKFQISNPKIQNPNKFQELKFQRRWAMERRLWDFEIWSLEFVWDLEFGIWNLDFASPPR